MRGFDQDVGVRGILAHIWRKEVHVIVSDLKVAAKKACKGVEIGFDSRR